MKFLFTQTMLGVDIQQSEIRFVQLSKMKNTYRLERIEACPLDDVYVDGKIKNWEKLERELTSLVQKNKLQKISAVVSLPVNLVRMQHVHLPIGLKEQSIKAEMLSRVQKELPGLTDSLCIDYIKLPSANAGYHHYFFVAAREAYITQYAACLKKTGMNIHIIDIDIFALQRMTALAAPLLGGEIHAIFQCSRYTAIFMVYHAHDIIFYHAFDIHDDIEASLKNKIQLYRAAVQQIQIHKLFILSCASIREKTVSSLAELQAMEILFLNPWDFIRLNKDADVSLLNDRPADFLIAGGLAMREKKHAAF